MHPSAIRGTGHGGAGSAGSMGSMRNNPMSKSQERIYSATQLVQALKSALAAIRDQLQVLTILDSNAMSWPGIQQAVDDLDFLVDMSGQTTGRLENDHRKMNETMQDALSETNTLRETLALQNQQKEELTQEVSQLNKEIKQLNSKLDAANREVQQQKQELWTLEKQRADLASECERYKQDNEFMEGEISTLRATVADQVQQLTSTKEELASRKADVGHLRNMTQDQKGQIEHLQRTLDSTSNQLREVQADLTQTRSDKEHYEKESDRLQDESARLSAELNKATKEVERLKEWQEVLKKVDADKLREEQDGRMKDRLEAEAQRAALDKALSNAQSDADHKEEKLQAKSVEAEQLGKQLQLANMQVRELQKGLTTLQAEKAGVERQRDEGKTQVAKLQSQIQAANIASMQQDKNRSAAESKAREEWAAERARLVSAAEESRREQAVQKALAEGWARDLREASERLEKEQSRAHTLQAKMDEMAREQASGSMDQVKNVAALEGQVTSLKAQVETKETEVKRLKAEFQSERKRLEKIVESLQRECNEGAMEVHRLRNGEGSRLPPLKVAVTLQDELDNLKRMITSMPAGSGGGAGDRLPVVNRTYPTR